MQDMRSEADIILNVAEPIAAPVSVPGALSMNVLWANKHWQGLVNDRPLSDILDPHQFAAMQTWAENPHAKDASTIFVLRLKNPKINLELVKTRLPPQPTTIFAHVMVTSIRSQPIPRRRRAARASGSTDGSTVALGTLDETSDRYYESSVPSDAPEIPPDLIVAPESTQNHFVFSTIADLVDSDQVHDAPRVPAAYAEYFDKFDYAGVREEATPQCHLLLEETDWSKTTAGPRENWPPEIAAIISLVFTSAGQDSVWVGSDLHVIYSNSSIHMVNHPEAFGKPIREIWGGFWDIMGPLVDRALAGEPIIRENDRILFYRRDTDRYVEKYHTINFLPIFDSRNRVVAIYNPTRDNTDRILARRRLTTVRQLVDKVSFARSSEEFYAAVASVLESNPADAPFMMFYSVNPAEAEDGGIPIETNSTLLELRLESSVGVPDSHPAAPKLITITMRKQRSPPGQEETTKTSKSPDIGYIPGYLPPGARGFQKPDDGADSVASNTPLTEWPISRALRTRQCVLVEDCRELISGFPLRQWETLPDTAVIVPISSEAYSETTPPAVMILGLNLYRPLDPEYDDWIQQIRGHLLASLGSVRALEEEIKARQDRERLERAQRAWFRGAAHEFKSPLTLIAGPLEDMVHTKLTETQHASVKLALRNVNRLTQLVSTFLDFTRLEAGRVNANFTPIDLPAFITELGTVFRPAMERIGISFKLNVQPRSEKVCLDPLLLEMVVSNLLGNALKFAKHGAVSLNLDFDDYANVTVADTGVGIPISEVVKVTDWFQRSSGTANPEGSGVGLALVKEIIKLHNGELVILSSNAEESGAEHGSVFKAKFPLNHKSNAEHQLPITLSYGKNMAKDIANWADDTPENGSFSSSRSSTSGVASAGIVDGLMFGRSDKILIVDDDRSVLSYLTGIFSPYCKVIASSSVEEALDAIRNDAPDLVLSDILMHPRTGLELLGEIRDDPTIRLTPVVCVSAANDDDLRVAALVGGADDFLSKPFKPRELLLRVHLHMQMGKKRANLEKLFAQREKEMAVLSDYCPSGILRTDASGTVTYANRAFREPAGIGCEEHITSWWELCDGDVDTRARLHTAWNEIIEGNETTVNMQWKWSTGSTVSGVFIRLDKVSPGMSGIIACVNDISYQEERLREAERRRTEAEESRRQQELLVDLTSHEIRTPVSAILQCSSLVKENLTTLMDQLKFSGREGFRPTPQLMAELEDDLEALESIYQCGLVQERIAGDILSLARIQLNMLTLHDVEVDLQHEIRKVLSVFSSEARSKKINLRLSLGATLDRLQVSRVKTDPVRLGQVITNLIANAIRFTSGSAVRDITVQCDVSCEPPSGNSFKLPGKTPKLAASLPIDTPIYVYVSVLDTGPGMKESEMEGLFQRFHRAYRNVHADRQRATK